MSPRFAMLLAIAIAFSICSFEARHAQASCGNHVRLAGEMGIAELIVANSPDDSQSTLPADQRPCRGGSCGGGKPLSQSPARTSDITRIDQFANTVVSADGDDVPKSFVHPAHERRPSTFFSSRIDRPPRACSA